MRNGEDRAYDAHDEEDSLHSEFKAGVSCATRINAPKSSRWTSLESAFLGI